MLSSQVETNEQAIEAWEKYECIWTVEMGGFGPNYELAIQNLAFSILKEFLNKSPDVDDVEKLEKICAPIIDKLNKHYGYSGAQVGAAKNIAACFYRNGYKEALDMPEVKDRKILYINTLPRDENGKG